MKVGNPKNPPNPNLLPLFSHEILCNEPEYITAVRKRDYSLIKGKVLQSSDGMTIKDTTEFGWRDH